MTADPPKPTLILPPVYLALAVGGMMALAHILPVADFSGPAATRAGWTLIGLGVLLALAAAVQFLRRRTTIIPYYEPSALITGGVYRLTRNPIYLADVLVLLGCWLWIGAASGLIVVPAFVWVIQTRFIAVEERMLESKFGDGYRAYKARVRRWL